MNTLNIQVNYDDKVHQFNLVRENLSWDQLVIVLQTSIHQASDMKPLVLYYGLDGKTHELNDQDTFSQLVSFPDILGLRFYGDNKNNTIEDMKSVYILPLANDAFKKLADFVDIHYSELENNHHLSRSIGMLASSMTLSPGNYDDELNQLESWLDKSSKDHDKLNKRELRKQGHKLFKKLASRHDSHKFSPYFFMDKHHYHEFPPAPPCEYYNTGLNGFVPPPFPSSLHHFGRPGRPFKKFGGRGSYRSCFGNPTVFFELVSDDEQGDEMVQTENIEEALNKDNEEDIAENKNESSSDSDAIAEDEELFLVFPFGRPHGKPRFGGRGGFGGLGSRGGFGGRGGHSGPEFDGPDHHHRRGRPTFNRPNFKHPGFGGLGFGGPGFGGPGFHGPGGFGGRGRGRGCGRGGHRGRGGRFGELGRFEHDPVDTDFWKEFDQEDTRGMPFPSEHKYFYFA